MRYRLLLTVWLASDLLLFMLSYALAYFLRVGWILSSDFPFDRYLMAVVIAAPVWLLVLVTTRTFALTRSQATLRNIAYIDYAAVVGCAFFALTYYFLYGYFFSRLLLIFALLLTSVGTWVWHIVYERILRRLLRRHPPAFPTLIVGVTRESRRLIELLERHRSPLKPVAVLDGAGVKDKDIAGVPVLGKLNKLEDTLERHGITHLIQCSDLEQSLNLLSACRNRGITYGLLPSVLGIVERDERIESLEGQPVTIVSPERTPVFWFFR